jgi:hypothetical protein
MSENVHFLCVLGQYGKSLEQYLNEVTERSQSYALGCACSNTFFSFSMELCV